MFLFVTILFWTSLGILFYCYIGYGLLAWVFLAIKKLVTTKKIDKQLPGWPAVTIVITSYNEEKILGEKLKNTAALEYPPGNLKVIVVTDGSDDSSNSLVRDYPAVQLLHQLERKGKYAAIKRAMREIDTPIVVFSDANTMLNKEAVSRIVVHYANEKVGGVAGEKKIITTDNCSPVGQAEGWYWQYESFMKKMDAGIHTVIGAAGELFSIRTELFREFPDELILDDFVISMQTCLEGYRIEYEPKAFAAELPSVSLAEEEKRKVRISAGAYQSIGYLKDAMNFFKHPMLTFQFISRRLLRWLFCPVLLGVLFFSNAILVLEQSLNFYLVFFYGQLLFYFFATVGWILVRSGKKAGLFTIPFYFVFMNFCLVKGFLKHRNGSQTVIWEKSLREAVGK